MENNILFVKNRPIFVAGFLYTAAALITVLSSWAIGLRKFDLDLTISRYVALRQWTAVMYLIVAAVFVTLAVIHLIRSKINLIKKILYISAFACIFGCAVFPFNREWSNLSAEIHNYFAYGLMLIAIVTFVMTAIKPINREQRVFSTVAIGYAAYFIIFYAILKSEFFDDTIFLWENTFIYMFIAELITEYKESKALGIFAKRFPIAGIVGMGLCWLMYLTAPRHGLSIESYDSTYWNTMNIAGILCLVFFIIFALSFITYMLYRPLSQKRKILDIILRIIITPLVLGAALLNVYLSLFIFGGAGY